MGKGRLVVIEGSDASGKMTQVRLLLDALNETGINAKALDFPTYDSTFGDMIGRYLRGELGALNEITPEIPSLLYALDRYQYKEQMLKDLKAGVFLVANRYTQSNLAYQGAKFRDKKARNEFIRWIGSVEHRLPRPDLVIFLYLPLEFSKRLMEGRKDKKYLRGKKKDIHELDGAYQEGVAEVYKDLASDAKKWVTLECTKKGALRGPADIHNEILSILKKRRLL
jgi:dTMP kinase